MFETDISSVTFIEAVEKVPFRSPKHPPRWRIFRFIAVNTFVDALPFAGVLTVVDEPAAQAVFCGRLPAYAARFP